MHSIVNFVMTNLDQSSTHEQRLVVELRRGLVALAVLSALQTRAYGYSLQQTLADQGFDVEQGTLYPLLRRLDEQGLLDSDWTIDEGRPRKYYRLSEQGAMVLTSLKQQWGEMVKVMNGILGGHGTQSGTDEGYVEIAKGAGA